MGLIIMRTNPIAKRKPAVKKTVRKAVKKPVAKRKNITGNPTAYIIELVSSRNNIPNFSYWNGKNFQSEIYGRLRYKTKALATKYAKEIKSNYLFKEDAKQIRVLKD